MTHFDAETRMLGLLRVWEFVLGITACAVVSSGALLVLAGHSQVGGYFLGAGVAGLVVPLFVIARTWDGRYAEAKRRHDQS